MIRRNEQFARLKSGYLFPEIEQRKKQFLERHPTASLVSLAVGDTTAPIPPFITEALMQAARSLGSSAGYRGYGPEVGMEELREKISAVIYSGRISKEEIFVSDGACSDIGRLQMLFGPKVSVAVQDPTYPLYLEGSILQGVQTIVRMPCLPENDFFPKLETLPRTDLIYFCSPNNPTGAAATKKQLEALVGWAKGHRSVILFDNVYSFFIQDSNLPKSIYDISGAEDVAIETSSYSKMVGFTGVRLGWTVVPERLKYEDGTSVRADWQRLVTTIFNGASNISQRGGLAVLEPQGIKETKQLIVEYLDNAKLLKRALEKLASQGFDCKVFGGVHAPYLWTFFKGRKSWDVFQEFLEECHILTIPGVGFGQAGEGFVRFSALSKRQHIEEAIDRLLKK